MRTTTLLATSLTATQANAWWTPLPQTTWQITLSTSPTQPFPNVTALDYDMFDNPASTTTAAHSSGHKVICYFSAGSWEKWRPDAGQFNSSDLGQPLDGWPGERWLNVRSPAVRAIMQQRMDLAKQKGCDAIDPDNIDAYDNGGGGFGLTAADAVNYVQFLASEGHKRGMAVGLKNGGAIVSRVVSNVDFQVNEQCLQYSECGTFRPFINANKPVFEIEYRSGTPSQATVNGICTAPSRKGFSTIIKHMSLDAWVIDCPTSASAVLASNTTSTPATVMSATISPPISMPNGAVAVRYPLALALLAVAFAAIF